MVHEKHLAWLLMFGPIEDIFSPNHRVRVVENRSRWRANFNQVMGRAITPQEQEDYDEWCRAQEMKNYHADQR